MTAEVQTHLRRFGQGARPALALHCTLSHAGAWRGLGLALADRITLTAFDMPGHGKSVAWDGKSDVYRLCEAMALPLIDGPVDLIGHSFGAVVALRLALEHPRQIRSLSLYEPVFFAAAREHNRIAYEAYLDSCQPFLDAFAAGDLMDTARLFNRLWGDGRPWEEIPERTRGYMAARMPLALAQDDALFDDSAGLLAPGRLEGLGLPLLLMDGAKSPDIVHVINAALSERLPNVRHVRLPDAGHMGPITHPAEVGTAIGSLLEIA